MSILFKHNINWQYALGEVILIFIGITLAIGFNNWNEHRKDIKSWQEYSSRLYSDLQQDTAEINYIILGLSQKKDALQNIINSFLDESLKSKNPQAIAEKILEGEKFGWGQFSYSGTTFRDLQNTGNFNIIHDEKLRNLIVDYYENWELHKGRIFQRKSNFPKLVFKSISIEFIPGRFGDARKVKELSALPISNIDHFQDEFLSEIQHELNYAGFVQVVMLEIKNHATIILEYLKPSNSSKKN